MRRLLVPAALALALFASAASAFCDDLKIAVLAPLTGPVPTFGETVANGAAMAVDECNAAGGVLGRRVELVLEDSQCDPTAAYDAAYKVIKVDMVHYIVGEVCSRASIPVSVLTDSEKVIQITPTSTNPRVTTDIAGGTKPYVFRACFIDSYQGVVAAHFLYENLGLQRVFVLTDPSNDYVSVMTEAFTKAFTGLGGSVVGSRTYTMSDTDFRDVVAAVKEADPQCVYMPDYYNMVNLAVKQAREAGIGALFMGSDGWATLDLDMRATDGCYFIDHYSGDDPREAVQGFVQRYRDKYRDEKNAPVSPDALAALSYDSMNLILQAIADAGADDTDMVRQALERMTFQGVTGKITFNAQHDPVKGAAIFKVTGEKPVFDSFVEP